MSHRQTLSFCAILFFHPLTAQSPAQTAVRILHWNDFHSQNVSWMAGQGHAAHRVGGSAALARYLRREAGDAENVLRLYAGDEYQGTPISTITRGASQFPLLNLLQPTAMTLGNHDFDYSADTLMARLVDTRFPAVSANLHWEATNAPIVPPYYIWRGEGVSAAIVGLMAPDFKLLSLPENTAGIHVLEPEERILYYHDTLKDSADLFIVLSHMGVDRDSVLAARVPVMDLIVGGHSHTALREPKYVQGIPIVQAYKRGRYLGCVDMLVDTEADSVLSLEAHLVEVLTDSIQPDPVVAARVSELEMQVSSFLDQTIGHLQEPWVLDEENECNIGNWLADVMRDHLQADVAFCNSGGIRKNLGAGPIRLRDIWEIAPFGNYFVAFQVAGARLLSILEKQVSEPREFLQVSGIRYSYDSTRPAGERMVEVLVGGKPISPTADYTVVVNNYMYGNFEAFFGAPKPPVAKRSTELDRDVFAQAVRDQGRISSSVEGRVTVLKGSTRNYGH